VTDIVRSISPAAKTLWTANSSTYADTHELVHRREASRSNEVWQADHTVLDITLLDDKGNAIRPWLSLVVDDYSRAIAGYYLSVSAPSAINTALALKQAIWHKEDSRWVICGIPEILYVDNGSDFTSEHINQASAALKMCVFRSIRPVIPITSGHLNRGIRPPMFSCCEA
jgi:putative transposase